MLTNLSEGTKVSPLTSNTSKQGLNILKYLKCIFLSNDPLLTVKIQYICKTKKRTNEFFLMKTGISTANFVS